MKSFRIHIFFESILLLLVVSQAVLLAEEPNQWQGKTVPLLVLASGKTYSQVTFSKIEADAITISYENGIVRISMEDLLPESRAAFGYDPVKAAEARERYAAQKAAIEDANAKRIAEEQAALEKRQFEEAKRIALQQAALEEQQVANAEATLRQKKFESAVKGTLIVLSITADGPLVQKYYKGGYSAMQSAISKIVGRGSSGAHVPPRRGSKVYLLRGYVGKPLVDEDIIEITYIETEEVFTYVTAVGSSATIHVLEALSQQ